MIKRGEISETGQYQELMEAKKAFYQLIEDYSIKGSKSTEEDAKDNEKEHSDSNDHGNSSSQNTLKDQQTVPKPEDPMDENGELIEEETMMVGSIQWHVYHIYAKAASYKYALLVLALFCIIQGCHIGTNTWLQSWVKVANHSSHGIGYFMGIYAVLIVIYMLLTVWSSYMTMVSAGVRASRRLHNTLLANVLRLPMSFFDTTPVGRIINRFSSDCFAIDEQIPWAFHDMFFCGAAVAGSLIVIAVTTPIFLVTLPPLAIVYYFVQTYYITSSRAFRRIESVTKSPMYQHFSETLSGVSTIRAMRLGERFTAESAKRSDQTSNAHFVWAVGNRWLNAWLEALGSLIVLAASLFAVLGRNKLSSSMVGMSLSYALNITQDITWFVRCYCELQNELVCVERVKEYSEKNQEAPNFTD
ncbi:Canalicular multispecific organic anion transporter 1, partial [Lunasporangiospora selenospora]